MVCITRQAEKAVGSKPVSSDPPSPLIQFLPPSFLPCLSSGVSVTENLFLIMMFPQSNRKLTKKDGCRDGVVHPTPIPEWKKYLLLLCQFYFTFISLWLSFLFFKCLLSSQLFYLSLWHCLSFLLLCFCVYFIFSLLVLLSILFLCHIFSPLLFILTVSFYGMNNL